MFNKTVPNSVIVPSPDNVETEEDMYGVTPSVSAFAQPEESFESLLQSFKRKVSAVGP